MKHSEGYKSRGYYAVVRLDFSKIMAEVSAAHCASKPLDFQKLFDENFRNSLCGG